VDTAALALAAYFPPYGYCVWSAFEAVKGGIADAQCDDKIRHQKDRLTDAFRVLPSKLITNSEQYSMYSESYSQALGEFQQHIAHVQQALTLLDQQWRELVAYNVERDKAAQTVLTADKLALLGRQYGVDNAVTSLFDNIGIAELAENVADVNSFLARKESALLQSCRSPSGLRAGEDYVDGLLYAGTAYRLLQKEPSLVPLASLLELSLDQIADGNGDAVNVIKAMPGCSSPPELLTKPNAKPRPSVVRPRTTVRSVLPLNSRPSRLAFQSSRLALLDLATPADTTDWSFCTLVSTAAGAYDCGAAGGGGTAYDSGFSGADQDPYSGILLAAQDGGYATDNRQVSADIGAATVNLNSRISDLESRFAKARAALPKWMADNEQALATGIAALTASSQLIASGRKTFSSQNAGAIGSAEDSINSFVQSPYDRASASALLANVAGADFSLPSIPSSAVLPDVPPIIGVSAIVRAYGNAAGLERNIERETRKVDEQLRDESALKNQALEDIEVARRFASTRTPEGVKIAAALLDDAAALRYFHAGTLAKISYSTITPDGVLGRSECGPGEPVPDDALSQVIARFEGDIAVYDIKLNAAKSVIQAGIADVSQRQDVLNQSSRLGSLAGSLFYEGYTSNASTVLKCASALIDIATAWLPGVNWGRSIYEVVTGKGLISGLPLDNLSYGVAVAAMVSGGMGEEAMSASTVESAISEVVDASHLQASEDAVKLFEKVWGVEEHVAPQLLEFSPHALDDGMASLDLSKSQVERLVEVGKPYFDGSALSADNTGLVYVAPLSKIGSLPAGAPDVMIVAAVSLDSIESFEVATVYKIDVPSLADLEAKTISDISGEKRFLPRPQ